MVLIFMILEFGIDDVEFDDVDFCDLRLVALRIGDIDIDDDIDFYHNIYIEDIEDDNDGIIDKIIWYYKYI